MSRSKNLKFMSLVTIICVVVAYFSVLSPTTAYFHNSDEEKRVDVTFNEISANASISQTAVSFNLKAATKFEDFNELLFDDVVYGQFVTVTNNGDTEAKIYLDVSVPTASASNGLKYIVFQTSPVSSPTNPSFTVPQGSNSSKGDLKEYIESTLHAYDSSFVTGVSESTAFSILNGYNGRSKSFSTAPTLNVGQSVGFQIYFWAEYGVIENTLKNTSSIASYIYSATITVSARQNNVAAA